MAPRAPASGPRNLEDTEKGLTKETTAPRRLKLAKEFEVEQIEQEGLQAWLFKALLEAAHDPEYQVPQWLRTATPLGIKVPIIPAGVFPPTEPKGVGPSMDKLVAIMESKPSAGEFKNYTSYEDNAGEADEQPARRPAAEHHPPRPSGIPNSPSPAITASPIANAPGSRSAMRPSAKSSHRTNAPPRGVDRIRPPAAARRRAARRLNDDLDSALIGGRDKK